MKNTSGLKPLGHAVLVAPYEPEMHRGIIEIPLEIKARTSMIEQRATVVEVGPMAWRDEIEPRAKPGDRVLVSKYAGHHARGPADGKLYRIINCNDVFCAVTAEVDIHEEAHDRVLSEIDLTERSVANG